MRGFLQSAQTYALAEGHQQFTPEHILKILLDDPEGMAAVAHRKGRRTAGRCAPLAWKRRSSQAAEGFGRQWTDLPGPSRWRKCFRPRKRLPRRPGDSFVTVERLLLALTIEKSAETAKILENAGITATSLNQSDKRNPQGQDRRFRRVPKKVTTR